MTASESVECRGGGNPPRGADFGFNLIGNISSNTGLGVVARNLVDLLLQKGVALSILDLDPGLGRTGARSPYDRIRVAEARALAHGINLFALQPSAIFTLAARQPGVFVHGDKLNVGMVMWELPTLPLPWADALKVLDVVAAASPFIASTFANHSSHLRTISALCPVPVPQRVTPSRSRFGLDPGEVVFLSSFEPNSDIERKNPFAAIRAFRQAFDRDGRHRLLIKLNNTPARGYGRAAVEDLTRFCADAPNIQVIDESLTYHDVLTLYATVDVFVSLHRAEGLGLALIEAMALGKPVIATGWSGNMAFMDHTNSCLVGYQLVPVKGTLPVYQKAYLRHQSFWAEPDVGEAASWMRSLATDPELRRSIGERAAKAIVQYNSLANDAHFIDELRTIARQRELLQICPARKDLKVRSLWDAARTRPVSSLERLARRLIR